MSNSIKVFTLKRKKKDETYPIFLRVIINSKKSEFYLNISVRNLADFDDLKQRIKANVFNAANHNLLISNAIQKTTQFFIDCEFKKYKPSVTNFNDYYNNVEKSEDFYSFAELAIAEMVSLVSKETITQFKCEISKLKKFKASLLTSDFDINFIRSYEIYMKTSLNNKTNTVSKTFKKLKRLLNIAVEKQIIEKSPFENIKLKYEKTNRSFLVIEELAKLEQLLIQNVDKKFNNVLTWFLFSCYTGLRYSDLYGLTWENINNNKINIIQEKTNEAVYVPIIDKAQNLLPETLVKAGKVFKLYTNQKCNEYLKLIMILAGINKKSISFHCARHTFATVSLNLGIRFEVVSKLLGHTDLKTTKIYARLLNETTDNEMLKWNKM